MLDLDALLKCMISRMIILLICLFAFFSNVACYAESLCDKFTTIPNVTEKNKNKFTKKNEKIKEIDFDKILDDSIKRQLKRIIVNI